MLKCNIDNIPREDLYWKKVELEDEEFALERKMKRLKSAQKIKACMDEEFELIEAIREVELHMKMLNI